MKLVKAFVHHVRSAGVVEALADAGFRNITLHDVIGALKPLTDSESKYSVDADRLMISEVRISLVVEDRSVDEVTSIIRRVAAVGPGNKAGQDLKSSKPDHLRFGMAIVHMADLMSQHARQFFRRFGLIKKFSGNDDVAA